MTVESVQQCAIPRIGAYNGVLVMVHGCCRAVPGTVLSFTFIEWAPDTGFAHSA